MLLEGQPRADLPGFPKGFLFSYSSKNSPIISVSISEKNKDERSLNFLSEGKIFVIVFPFGIKSILKKTPGSDEGNEEALCSVSKASPSHPRTNPGR